MGFSDTSYRKVEAEPRIPIQHNQFLQLARGDAPLDSLLNGGVGAVEGEYSGDFVDGDALVGAHPLTSPRQAGNIRAEVDNERRARGTGLNTWPADRRLEPSGTLHRELTDRKRIVANSRGWL